MIAAMIRTMTRTSTNWLSRIRRGLTLAVWISSFGPKRDSRWAASRLVRPRGEESNFWRTASARRACQSSAIARRTFAFVIKLVADILRSGPVGRSERRRVGAPRSNRDDQAARVFTKTNRTEGGSYRGRTG